MLEVSDLCCLFAPFDERRCVVPCLQVQIESNILNHVLKYGPLVNYIIVVQIITTFILQI